MTEKLRPAPPINPKPHLERPVRDRTLYPQAKSLKGGMPKPRRGLYL